MGFNENLSRICIQRMKEDARRIDDLMNLQVDPNFEAEIKEFVAQEIKEKMDDYIRTWNLLTYYFEKPQIEQTPSVKEIHDTLIQKKAPQIGVVTKSADRLEQILIEDLNVSPEEEINSIQSLLRLYSDIIKRRGDVEFQIISATSKKESMPETEVGLTEEANLSQTTKNILHMHGLFKESKKDEPVGKVLSCKKCGKTIPDLPYCPYCGNKTSEEKPESMTIPKTSTRDEQLEKTKLIVTKIEEEEETHSNQVTETAPSVKEVPQRLRTISEIITDLSISIGLVGLVSGIYIITLIQSPTNVSSDVIYQVVLSILDNLPGIPFSINLFKEYNIVILGFYTILVGLITLLISYGLWKRIYWARVSSIILYGFAIIADLLNITYYKLANTPLGVFISIIELSIIGVVAVGDFWK